VETVKSEREKQLEEIVRKLVPATRDVMWCALVWNDHNFDHQALLDHASRAATALGFPRGTVGDQVDRVNQWLEHVDKVLGPPCPVANRS
jgi:hypothetical protein